MRPHRHRVARRARARAASASSRTRHEQVAAHAADGYARASGKPGVLLTHLGPGLTNAATGVANAALDSIPMVVIAGDVPSYYYGRHPHQEVNLHQDADQFQIYRPFCKRVYRVDRVARSAAHHGARVPSRADRAARARCWSTCRWTSSRPTCRSTRFSKVPAGDRAADDRRGDRGADRRRAGAAPSVRCSTPAAACCRRARRRSSRRSPKRSRCRSRTR